MDKKIFRDISYGMYVVTSKDSGCIINTLTQVTSENPAITISLNKENYTNEVIKKENTFVVSIISENVDKNIISTFGFQSSKDVDKFKNFEYETINNTKVLKDTIGYLVCEVINIVDSGTHDIFIAKVIDTKKNNDDVPMTYKYYHEVIKGKAPSKAPTYVEEKEEGYICDVCGYVHKKELTDDFVCPICGVDASHFKKIN